MGKRPLTLTMIRNIHRAMAIPADILISEPRALKVSKSRTAPGRRIGIRPSVARATVPSGRDPSAADTVQARITYLLGSPKKSWPQYAQLLGRLQQAGVELRLGLRAMRGRPLISTTVPYRLPPLFMRSKSASPIWRA